MAARKPVRFADLQSNSGEVVEREMINRTHGYPTGTGQVPVWFVCPFCMTPVKAWLWSLSGGGKRCPNCKALFGSSGTGYQWKDKVR